ncbi:hypothetical protein [Thalassotalea sp. ND16A]|uniref:hypothetical protein n=1 Tax=Thalassotalea sp. ND16A TaxID=1535422 RepID=UPI00051DFC48|nr:hypothetical protein [Thalassotalea sp. ND16A]KGJ89446.1 hypothetical protein ND16A_2339 [Thalassotalea sp. ND16A]
MKTFTKIYLFSMVLAISFQATAKESFTFGAGLGTFYSGLGVNVGVQSETELKYLSFGCVSYSSLAGETCGAGMGWVKTDLFNSTNTKHGTSIYLGIVASEDNHFDDDAVYGVGLGYHYFFNGISHSGTNLGFTITAGNDDDGLDIGGIIQLGYQF